MTAPSEPLAGYERVASLAELPPGSLKAVRAGELAIALCNVDGEIFAVEDNCSHQHFPLSRGELDDETLTCDWHGAMFDVRTGDPLSLPAVEPIRTFQVRVVNGDVYVRTEGEAPTPPEALVLRETLKEGDFP
jgi:3-phenylpropionate/trans-cinnamate dioxygenase ferredoxin subunit